MEVKKIADAFWKVAQMDPDFTDKATEGIGHKLEAAEIAEAANASR